MEAERAKPTENNEENMALPPLRPSERGLQDGTNGPGVAMVAYGQEIPQQMAASLEFSPSLIDQNASEDMSDVYFLIADFLRRATPCTRAAAVLEEELNAMGLLRTAVNWKGESQPATYTDVHLRHKRLPSTQLVALIRKGASGKTSYSRIHEPVQSTSEERRSAIDALIQLWRNIRLNERKINQTNYLLEKIKLKKLHGMEPDEVDLVAEHRCSKQLIEFEIQRSKDITTANTTWKQVLVWGMTKSITAPKTNYFRHLRHQATTGRAFRPNALPPQFVYSRYRVLKTLSGHLQIHVFCVTYDKSGNYIITGADDRLVKIWSARTGDLLYTLHGHVGNITDMEVHPSNGLLVTSSDDKTARVWEISTGFSVAVLVGHTSDVNTTRFHPTENIVMSASDDGSCCIYRLPDVVPPTGPETKTETVQRLFKQNAYCRNIKPFAVLNHTSERINRSSKVLSFAFSPNGQFVVTGSQDGLGRIWRISDLLQDSDPQQIVEQEVVDSVVNSIPQEAQVSNANFVVQQRPADAPEQPGAVNPHWADSVVITDPIATLNGHTQVISSIQFHPKGDAIATCSMKDGTTRLWRWSSSKPFDKITHTILRGPEMLLSTRRATSELSTDQILWSSDGSRLITLHSRKPEVTGNWSQAIRIWDPKTCSPLLTLSHPSLGHSNAVFALDSHPHDWRILLTAGYDGKIIIWDIETGQILRRFQNWESTTNTDGCAILDVSFSPCGDNFAVTDRAGRLIIFGTGSGDSLKASPCEQYFSNDYAPIDLDTNLNVVDRETQVQPHLLPRSVLMDMGRNVYPQQPIHLMQPLSVHEYSANLNMRQKQAMSSQGFKSIIDEDAVEPFVNAKFVQEPVLAPVVKSSAPVKAYRLNGEAVTAAELRRRRRSTADDQAERDTSILNDELPSSEDDDEDFQVNAQVGDEEEDEDLDDEDDDDSESDGPENLDTDMVGYNDRGARSLRSRRRLRSVDDESEDELPSRNRRRIRARRISDDEEETKEEIPQEVAIVQSRQENMDEEIVIESTEGFTVSGNQRDRFDETKTYSQMFAQKSSITCGFCGRGDQGGMFALPGSLMGQHPLINGNQRVFVHDQCAISSPLSFFHDGSWYNVVKELRRGRLLRCMHCGERGATIGCNMESCKVTIHLPCGMVNGYEVDSVQYFCSKHATKKSSSGLPQSSTSTESFIRRMGHQYDRTYCQQATSSPLLALIPQVGDTLVYCSQGHEVFLRSFPSKCQPPFKRFPKPIAAVQCRVVDIIYKFPPVEAYPNQKRIIMELVLDVLGVPQSFFEAERTFGLFDFGNFVPVNDQFVQDESNSRQKWRFRVQYQPSECAEFLLLEQKFISGFQVDWVVGGTVQMPYHTLDEYGMIQGTQMDIGKILEMSPLNPEFYSPWECITVQWENEDSPCRVSPWELESEESNFVPPTLLERDAILQGLNSIRQLSVAAGFNEAVPLSTPDYHIMIPNPMDLGLICNRIESNYYRQVDALLADVKLMVKNCETYNVESSLIAQNARSVLTNIMTLLNQIYPGYPWLPDVLENEEFFPLEAQAQEAPGPQTQPQIVRHRPLKRENDAIQGANKRSSAERDMKIMLQMRLPIAQREAFQKIVSQGKLVECLTQVHTHAQAEDSYLIFAQPVTDDIAPGYSSIITNPMDFATMKAKIPQYPTLSSYYDDYMLIIENATTYNQPGTFVFTEAKRMKSVLSKCFGRVLGNAKGKAKASKKYVSDEESAVSSEESEEEEEEDDQPSEDEEEENEVAEEEDEEEDEDDESESESDDDSDSNRRKKPQRRPAQKKSRRRHSFD